MKKKNLRLFLTVTIIVVTLLSACSGEGDNFLPNDEIPISDEAPSMQTEPDPIVSDAKSSDIVLSSQTEEDEEVKEPKMVRIDADGGLRMRSGPGTDYDIIRVIPQNAYAEVTKGEEDNPDWIYVSYDGDSGWVSKEFTSEAVDVVQAPEYNSTSWAKVYYDYLSTFEAMTYTSTTYGSTHTVAGRITGGEKTPCSAIDFCIFDGYDYPVLICWDGEPLDENGNMDGFIFAPNVYLVENEKLIPIDYSNPKWQSFVAIGGYPEPKGNSVANFAFKPENGGEPENVEKALAWLEKQI